MLAAARSRQNTLVRLNKLTSLENIKSFISIFVLHDVDKVEALLDASHTLLAELLHLQVAGWTADLASVLRLSFNGGLAPAALAIS